jgi:hypothetical protein
MRQTVKDDTVSTDDWTKRSLAPWARPENCEFNCAYWAFEAVDVPAGCAMKS